MVNKKYEEYINLYDLHTIQICLDDIRLVQKTFKKIRSEDSHKNLSKEDESKAFNMAMNFNLLCTKTRRYEQKEQTIKEWLERDKTHQDKLDSTPPPSNILCPNCKTEMIAGDFKYLDYSYNDKRKMRVLFFFSCNQCNKRLGVYDNGKIRKSKPELCPNCKSEIKINFERDKEVVTTTKTCIKCGFKDVEVEDFQKEREKRELKEKQEKELLDKYRDVFCLSDKKGKENIELLESMRVAGAVYDEKANKYDDPVYDHIAKINKINVTELQNLISEKLTDKNYRIVSFSKPEISKNITVPFIIQDDNSSRKNHESVKKLKALLKDNLENTNWRLLNNYIGYRLGYLEGVLVGYEGEEDLIKLFKSQPKKEMEPKIVISKEQKDKYSSNALVQLARLSGEHEAIQKLRKRRLKAEPDGFNLESDKNYSCDICDRHYYGDEIWWNLDGKRCLDCKRNIDRGIIPSIKSRYDNEDEWFTDWQVKSNYGVQPATREKLKRQNFNRKSFKRY